MRTLRRTMVLSAWIFCVNALGDATLRFHTTKRGDGVQHETRKLLIRQGEATMRASSPVGIDTSMRRDGKLVVVDHAMRSYVEIDPAIFEIFAASWPTLRVSSLGDVAGVAGIECQQHAVHAAARQIGQVCYARADQLGLSPQEVATAVRFVRQRAMLHYALHGTPQAQLPGDNRLAVLRTLRAGRQEIEMRLIGVKRVALAASDLAVPTGYEPVAAASATQWVERLAERGDANAKSLAGEAFLAGGVVPRDPRRALRYLHQAAQVGQMGAQLRLGELLLRGDYGVEADPIMARHWFAKAARGGHPQAQMRLFEMLRDGLGGDVDLAHACAWAVTAARGGRPDAMREAGGCLLNGTGVERDTEKALDYFARAADEGDHAAAYYLASTCGGDATTEEVMEALFYAQVASREHGNRHGLREKALRLSDRLSASLGQDGREQAMARFERWRQRQAGGGGHSGLTARP